jgi:hypothetical protein
VENKKRYKKNYIDKHQKVGLVLYDTPVTEAAEKSIAS